MLNRVIYKDKNISQKFWNENVETVIKILKEKKISGNDIVICKSDSHIGTYIQWLVKNELGFIPVFISGEFSIESIKLLNKNINSKILIENIGEKCYVHTIKKNNAKICNLPGESIIFVTSATSGNPKLVIRTKEQIDYEITRYSKYLNINKNDTILPIVPLFHSFGFISGMLLSLKLNTNLLIPDRILPRNIVELSNRNKATVILGVPYFFEKMIKLDNKYKLNDELKYIISSGSLMSSSLQSNFKKRFGKQLFQQYGSTETGSLSIGYNEKNSKIVGIPLPGVKFKIINDENNNPCIYVSTKTIGEYIINNKIVKLNKHLYKMGDLGKVNNKNELEILDRADSVLILAGKKIDKKFIISVIKKMEGIKGVKIYLYMNELFCEYYSDRDISIEEFFIHCRDKLAKFQIPKKYIRVNNLNSWKYKE